MGEIIGAFIMPHPPVIVPEVGRGDEIEAKKTIDACEKVSRRILELKPDTIILTTPHGPVFQDYIYMSPSDNLEGDLSKFGHSEIKMSFKNDLELLDKISRQSDIKGIPAGGLEEGIMRQYNISGKLDHGALVPLYFVKKQYNNFNLIHISIAGLPFLDLYKFGMAIGEAVENSTRRVVFLASGDLSHKLKEDGPYGFAREGVEFDRAFVKALQSGDIKGLMDLDESLLSAAAECGLRSFIMMFGSFDGNKINTKLYSYEGPFGVGYGVAEIQAGTVTTNKSLLETLKNDEKEKIDKLRSDEDIYVNLARQTVEQYVNTGKVLKIPEGLPNEIINKKAGTFVSLKKDGNLRGCIGTISATQPSIAEEIINNAISACSKDPRFSPVMKKELEHLVYSVDILKPSEPINSIEKLDVKKYGVIVTKGFRRGLLLPNLEGVDTPEQQVSIALQKAGIRSDEDYNMERFEVVRHK